MKPTAWIHKIQHALCLKEAASVLRLEREIERQQAPAEVTVGLGLGLGTH